MLCLLPVYTGISKVKVIIYLTEYIPEVPGKSTQAR